MPFPVSGRVIYEQNPLQQVICQLNFPQILRIQAAVPDAYQDAIRVDFPLFEESADQFLSPTIEVTPALRNAFRSFNLNLGRKAYVFATADSTVTITLTQDSISLKTTAYRRWEDFHSTLTSAVEPFIKIYEPAFYSRVGSRYIDVISRQKLALADIPWKALLKPHVAGEFTDDNAARAIETAARESLINLSNDGDSADPIGKVILRHGLGVVDQTQESCFYIDVDLYTESQTPLHEADSILHTFNRKAGNLFRWCISDRLRDALRPTPVPE